jgi:transitional endoplasmic reticulum ATPase
LYRDTFVRLGLRPPRGILLYGPPGCSKTTMVKALAGTAGATFLSLNVASVYSAYVGEAERAGALQGCYFGVRAHGEGR